MSNHLVDPPFDDGSVERLAGTVGIVAQAAATLQAGARLVR